MNEENKEQLATPMTNNTNRGHVTIYTDETDEESDDTDDMHQHPMAEKQMQNELVHVEPQAISLEPALIPQPQTIVPIIISSAPCLPIAPHALVAPVQVHNMVFSSPVIQPHVLTNTTQSISSTLNQSEKGFLGTVAISIGGTQPERHGYAGFTASSEPPIVEVKKPPRILNPAESALRELATKNAELLPGKVQGMFINFRRFIRPGVLLHTSQRTNCLIPKIPDEIRDFVVGAKKRSPIRVDPDNAYLKRRIVTPPPPLPQARANNAGACDYDHNEESTTVDENYESYEQEYDEDVNNAYHSSYNNYGYSSSYSRNDSYRGHSHYLAHNNQREFNEWNSQPGFSTYHNNTRGYPPPAKIPATQYVRESSGEEDDDEFNYCPPRIQR